MHGFVQTSLQNLHHSAPLETCFCMHGILFCRGQNVSVTDRRPWTLSGVLAKITSYARNPMLEGAAKLKFGPKTMDFIRCFGQNY